MKGEHIMEIDYSFFDLMLYFLLYSFLGWAAEVCCYAVADRQFVNRGFLNLPFELPYGILAVILITVLPTLNGQLVLQYLTCLLVYICVRGVTELFNSRLRRMAETGPEGGKYRRCLGNGLMAGILLVVYLVVHPLIFALTLVMPDLLVRILVVVFWTMVALDFFCVVNALRRSAAHPVAGKTRAGTDRLADRMGRAICGRLEKNYPGILSEEPGEKHCVFADGLCFDKLVWVFLVSSFLGALIEMVFVRITGGQWMNRSSLLYGTFSVVWGLGAVLLTVTLRRVAEKPDRYVFLAGFFVGGVYEYFCSVFTELVFGTVFWDYSEMPLNIGGRTNVLYCIFWGILAVAWVKVLYPPMSKGIEKIPALAGKLLTWVLVVLLACDGLLTMAAMVRYTARRTDPEPSGVVEKFLDTRYSDDWMEHRWPNMKITEEPTPEAP